MRSWQSIFENIWMTMKGRKVMKYLFQAVIFGAIVFFGGDGLAQVSASVASGFQSSVADANLAGGFSYLPNGDVIGFTQDYVNGPALIRFDANGDGLPVGKTKVLKQLTSFDFGAFVEVSPSGAFALAGIGGSASTIFHVDLATDTVTDFVDAPGNYDVAFIDESKFYLSANPGGFDPSLPNVISLVQVANPVAGEPVAEIFNAPSGPIVLNDMGDIYYIKGTFIYPPPPNSSALLKFKSADLAMAAGSSPPLGETASTLNIPLDGGYDLAYHSLNNGGGEVFISTVKETIFRLTESSGQLATFATLSDAAHPSAPPAVTILAVLNKFGTFDNNGPSSTVLGASVASNFFSSFSLLQITSQTYDADGDGIPASSDQCPLDAAKASPGSCGCGIVDVDSNNDKVIDCGAARSFATNVSPQVGTLSTTKGAIKLQMEKLAGSKLSYEIQIIGTGTNRGTTTLKTTSSRARKTGLKAGTYKVRYRSVQTIRGKVKRSRWSRIQTVKVK
jgi:hypothetical protein